MTDPAVQQRDFYVYALFREDGITPFYIGKGRGTRIEIHERDAPRFSSHKDRIIQNMIAAGIASIPKCKLIENLADPEAKQIEVDLIQLIGRWPKGPLANLTSGGDGVENLAPESRAKKSARNVSSWQNPEVRKKRINGISARWTPTRRAQHSEQVLAAMSPERIERMKLARKAAAERPEVRAAVKAAAANPIAREKKSIAMKKAWQDPIIRERRMAAAQNSQCSPDSRKKRSNIAKSNWANPEIRKKMMDSRKRYFEENPMSAEERAILVARITDPKVLAKSHTTNLLPEVRAKRIEAQKVAFSTPEAKAKRSAASKAVWARKKAQYAVESAKQH